MISPITPQSPHHLQLGEGVLLLDLNLDELASAAHPASALAAMLADSHGLLGATRAGCLLDCSPQLTDLEGGARRTPRAGTLLYSGWRVTLSGTLLELTPGNLTLLLAGARVNATTTAATLTLPSSAQPASGPTLYWVGRLGQGLLAVELRNVLPLKGITLRPGLRGEGEISFSLLAQQGEADGDLAPLRMLWLGVSA